MRRKLTWVVLLLGGLAWLGSAVVQASERRFPPPQFETDHQMPVLSFPAIDSFWQGMMDVGLLLGMLIVATWLVLRHRTRAGMVVLAAVALIYFGFIRQGCVCPIGSIQNVSLALSDTSYALPWIVGAFFLLPIVFTLIAGRVFCAGVCPLGAIQDLVGIRALQLPVWVDHSLGLLAYAYLGLAVLLAATGSGFVICEYDPFVSIFRMSGDTNMFLFGGGLLVVGMFVIRPYCRFLCPYGVILGCLSPAARHQPKLDPVGCINCHLCKDSCPVNAIMLPDRTQEALHELRDTTAQRRRRMMLALIAFPLLIALGVWSGYAASEALARMNGIVSLSDQVRANDPKARNNVKEAIEAYRNLGLADEELHARAAAVVGQFEIGAPILGSFLGFVVGFKLLQLSRSGSNHEYDIAQSRCVACGRCFEYCPHHPKNVALLQQLTVEGGQR